ncbi:toll/interleukin-1 receptor domain-containing protein [Streptomyces sp. STR69]|uniref:toll/interleukin-1 receptor domain-containing protein n=1 Tax=Streptomyces sp. STR69 TaxID=1796942 RepID=UPI0021C6383F|nr:toll/interleukin-1 receptor domain-containing protein [Streptomyces sp. STR69]
MHTRLTYQRQDERAAFALADALGRAGADVVPAVWPAAADGAPDPETVVVLLWSAAWDRTAMEPALLGVHVPVRLDDTPLPPALAGLRHVRLAQGWGRVSDEAAAMIVRLGFPALVPARPVRGTPTEQTVAISDFGPLGLFASCPRCGGSSERLRPYVTVDHQYDRALRLVICGACNWQDGCEL